MYRPDRLQIPFVIKEGQKCFLDNLLDGTSDNIRTVQECIFTLSKFKHVLNMHPAHMKGFRDNLFKLIFDIFTSSDLHVDFLLLHQSWRINVGAKGTALVSLAVFGSLSWLLILKCQKNVIKCHNGWQNNYFWVSELHAHTCTRHLTSPRLDCSIPLARHVLENKLIKRQKNFKMLHLQAKSIIKKTKDIIKLERGCQEKWMKVVCFFS